jgi:hypothetical protein
MTNRERREAKRAVDAAAAREADRLLDAWLTALNSGTRSEEIAAREAYYAALRAG